MIAEKVKVADSFLTRLVGLLRSKGLNDDEGMLISPCNQVHTFGMRFDIDVIFLSKERRVLEIIHTMRPGKMSKYIKKAQSALELRAGTAEKHGVKQFDYLIMGKN